MGASAIAPLNNVSNNNTRNLGASYISNDGIKDGRVDGRRDWQAMAHMRQEAV